MNLKFFRFEFMALRRDECKILQDDLESPSLSWLQLFKTHELNQELSTSYQKTRDRYIQQALQHHNADYLKIS
ncbi:MAG: hypothetical protein WBM44_03735 [Waterburya sp.]